MRDNVLVKTIYIYIGNVYLTPSVLNNNQHADGPPLVSDEVNLLPP
jgi:hypothetical protein